MKKQINSISYLLIPFIFILVAWIGLGVVSSLEANEINVDLKGKGTFEITIKIGSEYIKYEEKVELPYSYSGQHRPDDMVRVVIHKGSGCLEVIIHKDHKIIKERVCNTRLIMEV